MNGSTQLGITLDGNCIRSLDPGGPAYTSKRLHVGDIILEVDGKKATENNICQLMLGNDKPGHPVLLTVAKLSPQARQPTHSSASL